MKETLLTLLEKCETPKEMELVVKGALLERSYEEVLEDLILGYHLARCEKDLRERDFRKIILRLELAEAALIANEIEYF